MSNPHFIPPAAEAQTDAPHEQTTHPPAPYHNTSAPKKDEVRSTPSFFWSWLAPTARRCAALSVVAAALWWLVFPTVYAVSNQAVLNAQTAQIRSPVDGVVLNLHHDIGDRIEVETCLAVVAGEGVSESHLAALQTRRSEIAAKITRLTLTLKEIKPALAASKAQHASYCEALVASLEASAGESEARLKMEKLVRDFAVKRLRRAETLRAQNSVSLSEMEDFTEKAEVARARIAIEESGLKKIKANLSAARENGYVIETPYFHQRAEELTLRAPELEAELGEMNELLTAVDREIAQHKSELDRQKSACLTSPVEGVVWSRHGSRGQIVKSNEALYEIAAYRTLFVEALLSERHLATIGPGCQATINLTGGRTLFGKVRAVRTMGPSDREPCFALKVADSDLKQARVLIDFDELPDDAPALIGRHVGVLITREDPSWCDRLASFLFSNLRL